MAGGLKRDGWYVIGIGRKKLLRNGRSGTALVKKVHDSSEATTEWRQFAWELEIHVDGATPYRVDGLLSGPVTKVRNVNAGSEIPIKVHPTKPGRVAIDWDAISA